MNGLNRFCVLVIATVLAFSVVTAPSAFGAPIMVNLVSAAYSDIQPPPPQDMLLTFTLTQGVGTFSGNNGMLGGLDAAQLEVDLSHTMVTPPPPMVSGTVTINTLGNMLITFSDMTHHATFQISNATIMADFSPNGTATIDGQAVLKDNNFDPTVVDLSAYSGPNGSDFQAVFHGLQFTGVSGAPPKVVWSGPVVAGVSITPHSIPEPASFATWVVLGIGGLMAIRRRRR
jgi:hypothetical protein